MPSISTLIIVVIWTVVVWTGIDSGMTIARVPGPAVMPVFLLAMPLVFFGLASLWAPRSPFYHPKLALFFNTRFGPNAFELFLVRLKPILLFAAAALIQGAIGMWQLNSAGASAGMYSTCGFFLSAGLGFLLMHFVLYFRKIPGVYPTWTLAPDVARSVTAEPERKPIREALRLYWQYLIGIAVIPSVLAINEQFFQFPFEYFMALFFGAAFLAAWPYLSGKATYTFWIVAAGVFMAGGFAAVAITALLRLATA
jgi:hypothetical protein